MRSLFSLDEQPTIHWKERAHYKGCNNLWTHCNMSVKFFSLLPTTVMFIERLLLSLVKLTVHIPCSIFYFSFSLKHSFSLSLSIHFIFFISFFTNFLNLSLKLLIVSLRILFIFFYSFFFFLHTLSLSQAITCLFLSLSFLFYFLVYTLFFSRY